jgi:hypothetical protein
VGPPESTSKGWILLFYGNGSKTGSTRGVFDRNLTLFKFKRSLEIDLNSWPILAIHKKETPIARGLFLFFQ